MGAIKVGVIGYGNAAKEFHLPFIQSIQDLEAYAVLQRSEAPQDPRTAPKGSHCTVDLPWIRHYRTATEFFADKAIDLVVVVTHTETHAAFAIQALEAGKHVIVDKPFAVSADEADQVIAAAEKAGKIVTYFQNRRWDGDFQTLLELKKKNPFGEITEAEIHYDFETPSWLKILPKKYTPGSGIAFALVLQYGDPMTGKIVTVKTTTVTPMNKQLKYWIRGTKGSYIKFQQRSTCPQEEHMNAGKSPDDPDFAKEPERFWGTLTTYDEFDSSIQKFDPETNKYTGQVPAIRGNFAKLYENLAQAIQGKEELVIKLPAIMDCLRILELAKESHENRVTVEWR
ncbi:hypothetical protein H9Q70_012394 [Fusarium xylarioides]|nr:hypothetical protein H9Q70_012394 [Fusarium xylarioides]